MDPSGRRRGLGSIAQGGQASQTRASRVDGRAISPRADRSRLGDSLFQLICPARVTWLRQNWAAALGAALLVGVLALNVASLTSMPALHGVESFYLSLNWSLFEGDGYKPSILLDAGVYDGVPDYWDARVAAIPSILGELILPTTLAAVRAPILLTALAALGVFWWAMRQIVGWDVALIATAALGSTWGFVTYSHWVRWDAMAVLALCAILALLVRGPPSLRAAALVGLIMGIGPDFVNSVPAAFPGVLVLCAWERDRRWERLGALGGGVLAGLALFFLLHFAPSFDFGEAREQFDVLYGPAGYGDFPLIEAVREFSLEPLLNEQQRYDDMVFFEWESILVALTLGVFASLALLVKAFGVTSRWLPMAGFAGLLAIAAVPVVGSSPHTELRDTIGPMLILAMALVVLLLIAALRERRPYPTNAVPAILLVGLLVGWAAYVSLRTVWYAGYALPFAVAAVAAALHSLSPEGRKKLVGAGGLAAATIASSLYLMNEIRTEPPEAARDEVAAERAREIVPPGKTVVGDWVYWWYFKDDRFRVNTTIWLQAWQHQDETFAQSFHRVCPDYVLLDDRWLDSYAPGAVEAAQEAPNVFPTDPRERDKLFALLRREYELEERMEVDDRTLAFWRRRAAECPPPDHPV